jgi:transcriptional regulator with XRE-family HTH domain
MKPKAQKTRKNIALKVAIIQRDITQREVARRTGIPEVRLSMFIRGCVAATEDEKRALAKVLRRGATALFPVIDQEEAVAS